MTRSPQSARWYILPTLVGAQFLCTAPWFAANAVLPDLQRDWHLPATAIGHLTTAVQLGFICGCLLYALTGLADRWSARVLFLGSAIGTAGLNALPYVLPGDLTTLLAVRVLVGFGLAGIYPIGMKIAAAWFPGRAGLSIGALVGALVGGTALPHLLRGVGADLGWPIVLGAVSAGAAAGGVALAWLVPDPTPPPAGTPATPMIGLRHLIRSRAYRRAAGAYFGHMWELYAFWTFLPLLLTSAGTGHESPTQSVRVAAGIAAGAAGCLIGGWVSLRSGSARVARCCLLVSGLCCLAAPLLPGLPPGWVVGLVVIWGAAAAGDSPQFSALVAQSLPPTQIGTALNLMNGVGFALTIISIQLCNHLLGHLPTHWLPLVLAPGPAVGWFLLRGEGVDPALSRPPSPPASAGRPSCPAALSAHPEGSRVRPPLSLSAGLAEFQEAVRKNENSRRGPAGTGNGW